MKKLYAIFLAAIPVFGIGIASTISTPNNEVKAEEPAFNGSKRKLLGDFSRDPKNEPEYSTQLPYNFSAMNIGSTWDTNRGDDVVVAVIDSGVNIYHEDFLKPEAQGVTITSSNVEQYSILNEKSALFYDKGSGTTTSTVVTEVGILKCHDKNTYDSQYHDYYSHGTCTASCIGAMVNGVGGTGIAPNVSLMILNAEDLYDTSIDVAIRYAVDNGADIISMSLGSYDSSDSNSKLSPTYDGAATILQDAIDYAYNNDVVVVASAGNESQGSHHSYPASNKHVIGVGALEKKSSTTISAFSCWNVSKNGKLDDDNNADVFAPGYVWTAGVNDKNNTSNVYIETNGTSFSCPLTAGAIALYKSANPTATPDEIEQALFNTCYDLGDPGRDATYGYGRVDVEAFLTANPLKSLSVSPISSTLTIQSDGTYNTQQLTLTFDPDDCDEEYKNGIWVSNDEDICTVSDTGLVTPISGGTTKVGYIAGKGNLSAEATITVVDYQNHPVESISLDKTSAEIGLDKTVQLNISFNPKRASNKNVTWSTSSSTVATVSDTGLVTGKAEGTATITATSEDGGHTATCTVQVKKAVPVTSTIGFQGAGSDQSTDISNGLMYYLTSDSDTSIISSMDGEKVFEGSNGWKLGSSGSKGQVIFYFSKNLDIKSIKLISSKYGANAATISISVGDSTFGSLTAGSSSNIITKDATGDSLTIAPSSRCYISSIEITYLSETGGGTTVVPVTSVSVSPTSKTLEVGDTQALIATVLPANATNNAVTWSSSDTSVATVNSSGVVTAKAVGNATITVTTKDGNKTATCSLTVKNSGTTIIAVTGVSITPASVSIKIGSTQTLSATIAPSNATNKSVSWSSENTAIATVNSSGVVTAKAAGTTTVTVKTADGNKTATCSVTVTDGGVAPISGKATIGFQGTGSDDSWSYMEESAMMSNLTSSSNKDIISSFSDAIRVYQGAQGWKIGTKNGGAFTINFKQTLEIKSIKVTIRPYGSDETSLSILSGATEYGSISSSETTKTITKTLSTSTLTFKTSSKRVYLDNVEISYGDSNIPVTGVSLNLDSTSMKVGSATTLVATVSPSNALDKAVSWSSSNNDVASVDANGLVTAKAAGTSIITVTTNDGNKTAQCIVTVTSGDTPSEVKVISISTASEISVELDKEYPIAYTINPENATNKNVSFESSDPTTATVDSKGVIRGVKEGVCTVTIKSIDGSNVSAAIVVKVIKKSGCSGSVAASAIACSVSLLGAMILLIKRKKEK